MATFTIRDASLDDADFIVESNIRLAVDSDDHVPNRDLLGKGVRAALSKPDMARYFIAEADGRRIATTMITYELTDWRNGVIWWLQSVFVEPEFRGQGVFQKIYQHIKTQAKANPDVKALRLYMLSSNARARRSYEHAGMVDSGYVVLEDDWS